MKEKTFGRLSSAQTEPEADQPARGSIRYSVQRAGDRCIEDFSRIVAYALSFFVIVNLSDDHHYLLFTVRGPARSTISYTIVAVVSLARPVRDTLLEIAELSQGHRRIRMPGVASLAPFMMSALARGADRPTICRP